jgi:hypothetical protein
VSGVGGLCVTAIAAWEWRPLFGCEFLKVLVWFQMVWIGWGIFG